jgi:hypothetical protein
VMDIVASQAIRSRDHDAIKGRATDLITQTVKSGTPQRGSTVAIVSKHLLVLPFPSLLLTMGS